MIINFNKHDGYPTDKGLALNLNEDKYFYAVAISCENFYKFLIILIFLIVFQCYFY